MGIVKGECMDKLTKDRECIKCKHFFDCAGKPKGARCINFEERKGKNDKDI